MKHKYKISTLFASAIMGAAILLTAWKGTLDWMGLAVVAVIFKLPGASALKNLFRSKYVPPVSKE